MITILRHIIRMLSSCPHDWVHPSQFCHGDDHGINHYERKCTVCGEEQRKVYHKYGEQRFAWKARKIVDR